MTTLDESDLKALEPFDAAEFLRALPRLLASPLLPTVAKNYFPQMELGALREKLSATPDVVAFQQNLVAVAIDALLAKTTRGLSVSGIENIDRHSGHTFISNHRDIVLDPALFTQQLVRNGIEGPWICFGDNLLRSELVNDLVKMNRGITVKRQLAPRDLMKWSFVLSALIARLRNAHHSVWIAQREGRAKDGRDETQSAVIKMLSLAAEEDWLAHFGKLSPVPVAISYEYEPCGLLKARELYLTRKTGSYQKSPREDVDSINEGLACAKGRVHLAIGKPMTNSLAVHCVEKTRNALMRSIAQRIDQEIRALYRLWPTHYIAADQKSGSPRYADKYSRAEWEEFTARLEGDLTRVDANDRSAIKQCYLEIYAAPVEALTVRTAAR